MKTIETTNTTSVVDVSTGEIIETTTSTQSINISRKVNKDNFIMAYLEDLSGFLRLENRTQISLLALL